MQLFIGNKNYSSWSMRPWVLMKQAGIEFDEVMLRFDGFTPESKFKQQITRHNPVGKVPVLQDEGLVVWDTLAIAEYLAEKFPEKNLWPQNREARARARSVCAEMHSGFNALRSAFPMNIEAHLPEVGERLLREQAAVRADLNRIIAMWSELLAVHGGPMLFGEFSIADAYFAPVVMRLHSYALPVPPAIKAYMERVRALPGVAAWINEALAEKDYLDFEEPYRKHR
ncbi:MAG: glutathione S-transferase family protein [Burkholderiales bacterium]